MGVPDSNQSIVFSFDPIFGVNLPTILELPPIKRLGLG